MRLPCCGPFDNDIILSIMNGGPVRFLFCTLVALAVAGLAQAGDHARLTVMVSIPPQKYIVERVAGDGVDVHVMVGPGDSPATYEPKASQLAALGESAVYFTIGVPYEHTWMKRILGAQPGLRVEDTTRDIRKTSLEMHDHGAGAGGANELTRDPHVWLSPRLVKKQAHVILETLTMLDPAHAAQFQKNYTAFVDDLTELDRDLQQIFAVSPQHAFMVFHPAWGYFAADYGLTMIPIEIGGGEPSARELANCIKEARDRNLKVIFAQPEFSTRAAETIARQLGAEVILISPLEEDWMSNMRLVADVFARAVQP